MTAQISERLLYDGRTLPLRSTPLTPFLQQHGKTDLFQMTSTANWRGYVGSWEIAEDRLYLVGLSGRLKDGSTANLDTVFPQSSGRVFAAWYSGTLHIPEGELLEYVHLGFASRYERDILLDIQHGVLVSSAVQENERSASGDNSATVPHGNGQKSLVARMMALILRR